MSKRGVGAQLKLEDGRVRSVILAKVRAGHRIEDTCRVAGISRTSLHRYLNQGEPPANPQEDTHQNGYKIRDETQPTGWRKLTRTEKERDQLYRQFWEDFQTAEAYYLDKLDKQLRTAAKKEGFNTLLKYAKLRFPERYGAEQAIYGAAATAKVESDAGSVELTFANIAMRAMQDESETE